MNKEEFIAAMRMNIETHLMQAQLKIAKLINEYPEFGAHPDLSVLRNKLKNALTDIRGIDLTEFDVKFDFWKGNNISGHFQLTPEEFVERFKESALYENWKNGEGYNLGRTILLFITIEAGLNSVLDEKQWPLIEETVRKEVFND